MINEVLVRDYIDRHELTLGGILFFDNFSWGVYDRFMNKDAETKIHYYYKIPAAYDSVKYMGLFSTPYIFPYPVLQTSLTDRRLAKKIFRHVVINYYRNNFSGFYSKDLEPRILSDYSVL